MPRPASRPPPARARKIPDSVLERGMRLAFAEAESVRGKTLPNPAVGAVLMKNGRVIGRGGTLPAGQAHAEIVALEQAGTAKNGAHRARGATLFVTLEPCSHFGRTPPCARALIAAGVARVVAACPDPNPLVSGKGFAMLRRAGIQVEVAAPASATRVRAEEFYAGFFFWVRNGRPRIVVKIAQSLDGRINARPGVETRLTGPEARRFTHGLRARADALLIGGRTLRVDNPDLTPREIAGAAHPEILVLTRQAKWASGYKVFAPGRKSKTHLILPENGSKVTKIKRKMTEIGRNGTILLPGKRPLIRELLGVFKERGYHEILVEGGRGVWSPFLNAGLWDELYLITAPKVLPRGEKWNAGLGSTWVKPLEFHRFTPLGPDILAEFRRVG